MRAIWRGCGLTTPPGIAYLSTLQSAAFRQGGSMNHAEAAVILQAAGSPFELATETVQGRPMTVFKTREKSLREKVANAAVHGDKEFLVYGDRRITFTEFVELTW